MIEIPVIPDTAPFQPHERIWLNGFLAGYFARQSIPQPGLPQENPQRSKSPLLILFGSQTGTAQALAKRMGREALARGLDARVRDAADFAAIEWGAEQVLFIVTSTYGDGDMPDNAQGFWDWLQTEAAAPALGHLRYAVLALGDRNYEHFCAAGKKIDARLEELGAKRLTPRIDCDIDYEGPARDWAQAALASVLETGTGLKDSAGDPSPSSSRIQAVAQPFPSQRDSLAAEEEPKTKDSAVFSRTNPFPADLLRNSCLNKPGSAKEVRHFELSLRASGLTYEAGDALGVVPLNCPMLVNELLAVLRCTGEEMVEAGAGDLPLREALSAHFDITKPSNELLAEIARRAPDCEAAVLLAPGQTAQLRAWLWGRDIVDLLRCLPAPIPCAELVPLLRKLSPRLYSISSSPKAHPGQVHLTVSALRYESHGRKRKGVASTFLADRVGNSERVRVYVQPSRGFKLPKDGNASVIMVGPGTGIAPFRAFLEERQGSGARGRNWLFFGDQRQTTDFLYEEELAAWLKEGHLTRLDTAFSRDQVEKIYVQHQMLARAPELWAWLQEGAHFYVCGDASRMAKDVDAALHQVVEKEGGLDRDAAVEFVNDLKKSQRYQRDVY